MKRLAAGLLAGALMLASPAWGAEVPAFSDVEPGSWYEEGVRVCVEEGLMEGVGDGRFAPEAPLSDVECGVLLLRLYDLGHGGAGTFEPAPEEWGKITFTTADGTAVTGYGGEDSWRWTALSRSDPGRPGISLDTPELDAWGQAQDGKDATLVLVGKEWAGTAVYYAGDSEKILYFDFARDLDGNQIGPSSSELTTARYLRPAPERWWRDAGYYAYSQGLLEYNSAFSSLLWDGQPGQPPITRWAFAEPLAIAAGELPALGQVTELPDVGPDGEYEQIILGLYSAGVLTGSDAYGTFHGEWGLTRAEAAGICARVLRPELRKTISPIPQAAFVPFQENGFYGLKDASGAVHIPAQYAYLVVEEDGAVVVTDLHGNKGILDVDGNVILPCLYPRIYNSPDQEGLVVVGTAGDYASPLHYNGKKGMIDTQGTIVIPLIYDFLTPFENGTASFVRQEGETLIFGHLEPDGTELLLTAEEVSPDDQLYMALRLLGVITP